MATSELPGTVVFAVPPEVVDQLLAVLKFVPAFPIQYLLMQLPPNGIDKIKRKMKIFFMMIN
jgi:hypothetical protein